MKMKLIVHKVCLPISRLKMYKTFKTKLKIAGGITPPNPFVDVIHTEPPPTLHSLIEDKEKLIKTRFNLNYTSDQKAHASADFEKDIISITTDSNYNSTSEYADAFLAFDLENRHHAHIPLLLDEPQKDYIEYPSPKQPNTTDNGTSPIFRKPIEDSVKEEDIFSSFFGFLFKDEEPENKADQLQELSSSTYNHTELKNEHEVPLKLLNILNVTKEKKENSSKADIPQRKNNKIIDPAPEPLLYDIKNPAISSSDLSAQTEMKNQDKADNLEVLRDVLLATLNGGPPVATNSANQQNQQSFLAHPLQGIPFIPAGYPPVNVDSKNAIYYNPIRSELDLIIPELSKNDNDFSHNNNSPDSYQVLPEDSSISNTESYVINPVDLDKLKQHQSEGEAKIFTKPVSKNAQDPAGILKLAGCNIYGRMYRVGRIISELSSPCLECKCTEVGVHCTPLDC